LPQTLRYPADFLDRPMDEARRLPAVFDLVFLGGGWFTRCRMAAIMAKASMTNET
jgi:hypothetical protein